jgi:hypothetical protein
MSWGRLGKGDSKGENQGGAASGTSLCHFLRPATSSTFRAGGVSSRAQAAAEELVLHGARKGPRDLKP